jgi:hypothetical protein
MALVPGLSEHAGAGETQVDVDAVIIDLDLDLANTDTAVPGAAAPSGCTTVAADAGAGPPFLAPPPPPHLQWVLHLARSLLAVHPGDLRDTQSYLQNMRPPNWGALHDILWEVLVAIPEPDDLEIIMPPGHNDG